ncbi:response regulator transcription factor [Anaeropeptidivorans aminofermentans]|jgi:DNA-binding response OmpR family regulator|uniref:response regulator transcription factor n=1 Tax=Anaeropeptidivorans aminofermentans TaxID=2934315 RepID=UPI00202404F4|nr:response regulator transcription factor [Anaeropeptidivorans aminofermentans]MBE6013326.1 response regulator transcription factor [Lachnospiraceae bacterium]
MTKSATILIVDDDPEIREIVHILLHREGFTVLEASDAATALLMLKSPVDLIILDIMMPGCSGLELCSQIRQTRTLPILFLSAKAQDTDKAEGFLRGGDDYLVKPFSSIELVSRIRALLRRCLIYQNPETAVKNEIRTGELYVNLDTGTVLLAGQKIVLTSIEYQVLRLLLQNRKKIFSARDIYERVWQEPFLPLSNNTVMVHIKNLRKKLEKDIGYPQYIRTAWGRGYYIE